MAGIPIKYFRDDFEDNLVAEAWDALATGGAAVAETGQQARFTLPSSGGVGPHTARYTSKSACDLTGDRWPWNIGTMVATGVAATAFMQFYSDGPNALQWIQLSGTLYARSIVAGVSVDRYSVAWNATTHKFLALEQSSTNILWRTSTDGITWTTRATVALSSLFAVTDLFIDQGATCGNVASPGSLRLDDVNLIRPTLTTAWNWTEQAREWIERLRNLALAASSGQACVAISETLDAAGDQVAPTYYAGPLGPDGHTLTVQPTLAAAQAMAVNLPLDDLWMLPAFLEGRYIRLYHRSITGSSYVLHEDYAHSILKADYFEGELFRGLRFEGHQFVADELSALSANIGKLTITDATGLPGWLYQGSGTGDTPTTGLKIYNVGGIGKLSTYNTSVEQVALDTDGKLKLAAGKIVGDVNGLSATIGNGAPDLNAGFRFVSGATLFSGVFAADYGSTFYHESLLISEAITGRDSWARILADAPSGRQSRVFLEADNVSVVATLELSTLSNGTLNVLAANTLLSGGLNVGTATGAVTGEISTSGSVAAGAAISPNVRLFSRGEDTGTTKYALFAQDSAAATKFYVRNDGLVFGDTILANGYRVGAVQVVGARRTGWAAATGTATRTTFVTSSVTLPQLAERVKALIDDLMTHGLIGA